MEEGRTPKVLVEWDPEVRRWREKLRNEYIDYVQENMNKFKFHFLYSIGH